MKIYIIGFLNFNILSSDYLRGKYIGEKLNKFYDFEYINYNKLNNYINIENSIFLFVRCYIKHFEHYNDFLNKINKNNILIHDILDFYSLVKDWYTNQKYIDFENKFNYLIVNSKFMKNKLQNILNIKEIFMIYHMYDERIIFNDNINIKPIYNGVPEKITIKNKKNYIIKCFDILNNTFEKSVHFCYLDKEHSYVFNHTSTKLATCIYTNGIFVCSYIPIFIELLGEDYPFLCNNENELHKKIEESILLLQNKEEYEKYLKKYNYLKDLLSPQNMINKYKKIFDNIIK